MQVGPMHITDLEREQAFMDDILEMAGICPMLSGPEDLMIKRMIGGYYIDAVARMLNALRRSGCHEEGNLVIDTEYYFRLVIMPCLINFNLCRDSTKISETIQWAMKICGGILIRNGWEYSWSEPEPIRQFKYRFPANKLDIVNTNIFTRIPPSMETSAVVYQNLKMVIRRKES